MAFIVLMSICTSFAVGAMLLIFLDDDTDNYTRGVALAAAFLTIGAVIFSALAGEWKEQATYYYDGMRVESDDIDFSQFIMTYDEEKNCYYLEKKGE